MLLEEVEERAGCSKQERGFGNVFVVIAGVSGLNGPSGREPSAETLLDVPYCVVLGLNSTSARKPPEEAVLDGPLLTVGSKESRSHFRAGMSVLLEGSEEGLGCSKHGDGFDCDRVSGLHSPNARKASEDSAGCPLLTAGSKES
ncbi:hypothetical protein BaRGS_00012497 [Batillaria attramentaria]|uniref:Uncharacterized protein n=1 Tax=Batillaria attramentaria TaxID=370345 RepID=A0ABD0LB07_9CAEN